MELMKPIINIVFVNRLVTYCLLFQQNSKIILKMVISIKKNNVKSGLNILQNKR